MSGKNAHTPIAVFDISSSAVAGAHVLIRTHHTEKDTDLGSVLAHTKAQALLTEDLNIDRFIEETVIELTKVLDTLKQADHHRPDKVFTLLASPWFVSQTRIISYKKSVPFTCTQKLVDSLVEKEVAYIMEHDMERFGHTEKDGIIIEKQLSQITLNGYKTNDPFEKKASSLELSLVVTVAPKTIIERFRDTFAKYYGHTTVQFITSPYATALVARDFLQAPEDIAVVDIGEEVTDIACVKNGMFLYQHSFPVGIYEFYRILAAAAPTSITEGEALLETLRLGKINPKEGERVQAALQFFGTSWQRALVQILSENHAGIVIPSHFYIVADPRFEQFFTTLIHTDPFLSHSALGGTVQAQFLTDETLRQHFHSLDTTAVDQTLLLASLFASRLM